MPGKSGLKELDTAEHSTAWQLYILYSGYWASVGAQVVKNLPAVQETWVQSLGQEDPWRREWLPTPVFLPGEAHGQRSLVAQTVKNLPANVGDPGSNPGLGTSPGEGNGYPLQYSCLEHSMDRGVWWATVHEAAELDTTERLSRQAYIQQKIILL